ncbi:hypothetical protein BD413DRAFT_614539 [Trametes elegans]|nr:hypothetical protein BD413DRAFT_614539 [Trametes elegans]
MRTRAAVITAIYRAILDSLEHFVGKWYATYAVIAYASEVAHKLNKLGLYGSSILVVDDGEGDTRQVNARHDIAEKQLVL